MASFDCSFCRMISSGCEMMSSIFQDSSRMALREKFLTTGTLTKSLRLHSQSRSALTSMGRDLRKLFCSSQLNLFLSWMDFSMQLPIFSSTGLVTLFLSTSSLSIFRFFFFSWLLERMFIISSPTQLMVQAREMHEANSMKIRHRASLELEGVRSPYPTDSIVVTDQQQAHTYFSNSDTCSSRTLSSQLSQLLVWARVRRVRAMRCAMKKLEMSSRAMRQYCSLVGLLIRLQSILAMSLRKSCSFSRKSALTYYISGRLEQMSTSSTTMQTKSTAKDYFKQWAMISRRVYMVRPSVLRTRNSFDKANSTTKTMETILSTCRQASSGWVLKTTPRLRMASSRKNRHTDIVVTAASILELLSIPGMSRNELLSTLHQLANYFYPKFGLSLFIFSMKIFDRLCTFYFCRMRLTFLWLASVAYLSCRLALILRMEFKVFVEILSLFSLSWPTISFWLMQGCRKLPEMTRFLPLSSSTLRSPAGLHPVYSFRRVRVPRWLPGPLELLQLFSRVFIIEFSSNFSSVLGWIRLGISFFIKLQNEFSKMQDGEYNKLTAQGPNFHIILLVFGGLVHKQRQSSVITIKLQEFRIIRQARVTGLLHFRHLIIIHRMRKVDQISG